MLKTPKMANRIACLLCIVISTLTNVTPTPKFPLNFTFGVATASYQVEGAWEEDGKSESIWDFFTHNFPTRIVDQSNGDVACDSYHKMDEDIQNLKKLRVNFYRFSISWCRILPSGYRTANGGVNEAGVNYYNRLINKLLENNIEPVVTIYHWDLPQVLQQLGGWTSSVIVNYYLDYARVCFERFGDRVKKWLTFNEPLQVCQDGYSDGTLAPGYQMEGIGGYMCAHNLLLSHAKAFHMYKNEFWSTQKGVIGMAIHSAWFEPKTSSQEDRRAAETMIQFYFGWFAHPIYSKEGDHPLVMRQRIANISKLQGYPESRLPRFTPEQIKEIRGTFDYLGLNHYTTLLAEPNYTFTQQPSFISDAGVTLSLNDKWEKTSRNYFRVVPWGMRKLLNWIRRSYGNPPVLITENGYAGFANETTHDPGRIRYNNGYLSETLKALTIDSCNVVGFTAWSLMDNFEWFDGYTMRFGMYHVDFTNINRTRRAKQSAFVYQNIIVTRSVNNTLSPTHFLH